MLITKDVQLAKAAILSGGIIAYPTEGVWGLGCDFTNLDALERLIKLKRRDPSKGLILLVNSFSLMASVSTISARKLSALIHARSGEVTGPVTWLIPANFDKLNPFILGGHNLVAVRLTTHPLARRLIKALKRPLVSTSANLAGGEPALTRDQLDPMLTKHLELILDGKTNNLAKPTPIFNLLTGEQVRA